MEQNVFDSDLCHVGSQTKIVSIACYRSEVLLLSVRQGFLCDLVGIESVGEDYSMLQERKWQNAFRCLAGSLNDTLRQSHTKETWEVMQVTV